MNAIQKEKIQAMRLRRIGYTEIAKEVGLPINTVKSYCRRTGLNTEALATAFDKCKHCGNPITKKAKTHPRKFCCEDCKRTWWNKHRYERHSDKMVVSSCRVCGIKIFDYEKANRKYCSRTCYEKRGEADGN